MEDVCNICTLLFCILRYQAMLTSTTCIAKVIEDLVLHFSLIVVKNLSSGRLKAVSGYEEDHLA